MRNSTSSRSKRALESSKYHDISQTKHSRLQARLLGHSKSIKFS